MHSIRVQVLAFISGLLLILLLLLNTYPLTSSRDAVFLEKKSSLTGQATVVASALAGLDRLEACARAAVAHAEAANRESSVYEDFADAVAALL